MILIFVGKHMSKLLIDTNILVYSIDEESKFFKRAQSILLDRSNDLYTTSKNLSEFLVVITRIPEKALSIPIALNVLREFMSFITILYSTQSSFAIFQELLEKNKPTGLKIHDYEIASIAITHQINKIATFNEKDFKEIKGLEVYPV